MEKQSTMVTIFSKSRLYKSQFSWDTVSDSTALHSLFSTNFLRSLHKFAVKLHRLHVSLQRGQGIFLPFLYFSIIYVQVKGSLVDD